MKISDNNLSLMPYNLTFNFDYMKGKRVNAIKKLLIPILTTGIIAMSTVAQSAPTGAIDKVVSQKSDTSVVAKLQANLIKAGISATVVSAYQIESSDLYWVQSTDVPSFFTDIEGKYVVQGQLIGIGTGKPVDISSVLTDKLTREQLENVNIEDMIVYPASIRTENKPKAIIYAFTDANCPFCKKLHSDVDVLNQMGIEVRYLAWPRNPQDLAINEAIWCSSDRKKAWNKAASEGIKPIIQTCNSPVVQQTELGNALGVEGTPAIFTENGEMIGGYLTPEDFAKILQLK